MRNNYCIILAGGFGTRLWPLSKRRKPKQFLDILGVGKTLLQQTFDRYKSVVPTENFIVVTSTYYKKMVLEQLPELSEEQVLEEPIRRDTAPAVAYAANKIRLKNTDAKLIVAPSDHLILDEEKFTNQLKRGLAFVGEEDALVTLGIKPNRPDTNYGYIQIDKKVDFNDYNNLYEVKTFTEKPSEEMAQVFIDTGEFFWNSGIFIWSVTSFLKALKEHLPEVDEAFSKGEKLYNTNNETAFINKTYSQCQGISLDYGILENAQNVYVLTANFGWNDMGSWNSYYDHCEKDENNNVLKGNQLYIHDTQNCIIDVHKERVLVVHGLKDFIVAENGKTLMICKRSNEHNIKSFVTDMRVKRGHSLY